MTVKLLAIDLDGTLLNKDRKISSKNQDAIRRAQDAGVTVMLASGRIRPSMVPFAESLGIEFPIVCGNGTYAYLAPEEPLYSLHLHSSVSEALIAYATEKDIHLNLYTSDAMYFLSETPWAELYRKRVETIIPQSYSPADAQTYIKAMIVDHPHHIQEHRKKLASILGVETRATESEAEYLEFMSTKATKGYALAQVAAQLGIEQGETAAIGDYLNDVEMLEWAGISAAVENAHSGAKQAAKVTVSSNELDGVAEFIDAYVLKQRQ